jgi:5'-nucleotidase/UDP-sugar diphosphatase
MFRMRVSKDSLLWGVSAALLTVLFLTQASCAAQQNADTVAITIFHTTDEHGHLLPQVPLGSDNTFGGAANVFSWLVEREGYDPDEHILLSGGDNWTGASISTWFEGIPMVQAFHLMGYDAAAIGNHEFDFGRDVMEHRLEEAEYPYVAANIRYAETGELADFAQPYVIKEVSGVRVGIVGLTTTSTPTTTHPKNIGELVFTDYVETLREFVPRMREEGAEVIVVLGHVCAQELVEIATNNAGIADVLFGGHCHQRFSEVVNGITIVASGSHLQSYARITVLYDRESRRVVDVSQEIVRARYVTDEGNPVEPDSQLAALIDEWRNDADSLLGEQIGYSTTGVERRSAMMGNWVTDAWLWAYPHADIALTNWAGFRAPVDSGPITTGDILASLPFENRLIEVAITGADLLANLECCGGATAGMTYTSGGRVVLDSGRVFHPDSTYYLLVNDFMHAGGAGYLFDQQDLQAYDTSIQWRQPVIDFTRSLGTSRGRPLESYLDTTARSPRGR